MSSSMRANVTEVGSIACDELSELGAGKKEGWLVDETNSILYALDSKTLALANRSSVLITPFHHSPVLKIFPDLSPIEREHISALEWLAFDHVSVIAIGTSCGHLLIYSLDRQLLLSQIIYPSKILGIRARGKRNLTEEVCVVLPGVLARIDGLDIKNLVEDSGRGRDEAENGKNLPCQLWSVNKYGKCTDAAIAFVMPPPLMEVQSSQRYFCGITVGEEAVISAYRLSEDRSRSVVGAILSKVVPTISSLSQLIWRRERSPAKKPEAQSQSFAKASPITCIRDNPRKGEKMALSPKGTLAAITDSLGRILLLDTQALVVVRLWKGYRDARCLFMEVANGGNESSLCLAIHAPRKGIIEVWQMRTGPRVLSIPCAKGSVILQPNVSSPAQVFVLNGDSGILSVLKLIN